MIELSTSLGVSVLILLLQVWMPGVVLCFFLARKVSWTLVDAFFVGLLWNALIGILVVPVWNDTVNISFIIKVTTGLLLVFFLFIAFYRGNYTERLKAIIKRSCSVAHFFLGAAVVLIILMFIATHNLGFDDVAHLKYINGVMGGEPYPVFRELVNRWEAARYPLFGIMIGGLGKGVAGSGFFIYYLLGIAVLVAFLLKIYEMVLLGNKGQRVGLVTVSLVASVLMIVSLDNYFNFGVYPLQQAKLLAIIGLTYLLIGWGKQRNQFYLFVGASLIMLATLYHLNIALLYIVVTPFILLFIYFRRQSKKQWLTYSAFLLLLPLITIPAALSSDTGFLQYKKEPVSISTGEPTIKKEKPSKFEQFFIKAKKMLLWIKEGRYKNKYFKRAFSVEIFLIPLIVLLAMQIGLSSQLSMIVIVATSLILVQQLASTVPKQLFASTFRSGMGWILYDIARSGIRFKNLQGRIFTDPYTRLYLKLFGVQRVETLEGRNELLLLSPSFSTDARSYVASRIRLSEKDYILFNGRYWGVTDVSQWEGNKESKLGSLLVSLNDFNNTGNVQRLSDVARRGVGYIKAQINAPMLLQVPDLTQEGRNYYERVLDKLPEKAVTIYHDSALVRIRNMRKGEKMTFEFNGIGVAEYLGHFLPQKNIKILGEAKGKRRSKKLEFEVLENVNNVSLLFRMHSGHLNGLGTINSVTVQQQNQPIGSTVE